MNLTIKLYYYCPLHLSFYRGVFGHFTGERPWMPFDELVIDKMAKVVGKII